MHLAKSSVWVAALVLLSLPIFHPCRGQQDSPLVLHVPTNPPNGDIPNSGHMRLTVPSQKVNFQYQEVLLLEEEKRYPEALAKADALVQGDPQNITPYVIRGEIYSEMSQWDKADQDYQSILRIDPSNFPALFNRSEVKLMKKDYEGARAGFFPLEKNADWGDLATYKVFVCDLFGDHQLEASTELDTFNRAGTHPSYYYANATWSFYHKDPDKAKSWLDSAMRIYPRKIIYFYSATLVTNGYIKPLPDDVEVP